MRLFGTIASLVCASFVLAGCSLLGIAGGSGTGSAGQPSGSQSTSSSAAEVHPTPVGTKPKFQPEVVPAAAAANQRLFVIVLEQGLVSEGISANPAATAERLRAVGFDPAGILWTDPSTAIGLISDTVFVSAQVGAECLIGQYGLSIQTVVVSVVPALPSGGCLVGADLNHF